MANNRLQSRRDPAAVFAVLADPRTYGYVVVGSRTIRRFDPAWPEVGSRFHHSLGFGVTLVRDHTDVTESLRDERLAMHTFMRPWGVNEVVFQITPRDGGALIEMSERAIAGPAAAPVVRRIAEGVFWTRNRLVLRRLRAEIDRRASRIERRDGAPEADTRE